ncbi:hypothetical protein [Chroococcidiopsis sp.]|uniref:hypothetical protein n=1 Tax=Chroococcidiopsis sp. TaxID=3088168 RepID=UPI003F401771
MPKKLGDTGDFKPRKLPKPKAIGDYKPGNRFSFRVLGDKPKPDNDCGEITIPDYTRNNKNVGRAQGFAVEYSGGQIENYKKQYPRFERAIALNDDGRVESDNGVINYLFCSHSSPTGYWSVTITPPVPPSYYIEAGDPLNIICPAPFVIEQVESNASEFVWKQLSGRTVTIEPVNVINPEINILDDPRSIQPIRLEISVLNQPEIKDELTIYTTPTDIIDSLSFTPGRGIINVPLDCQLVELTIAQVNPPNSSRNAYFYECTSERKRYFGWKNPTCDADKLVGFIIQKTTSTQAYFDVQRYSITDLRLFVADIGVQYRILSIFQLFNSTQIISKTYFSFADTGANANSLLLADDTFCNKHSSYLTTENETTFYLPRWSKYELTRLPLNRQLFNFFDDFNDISKRTQFNSLGQVGRGAQVGDKTVEIFFFGFQLNGSYAITRLKLGGVIIG